MTMQIEEGKYYRTRGGLKVGPMKPSGYKEWPWIVVRGDCQCWDYNGVGISGTYSPDLVAEWTDDTPKRWRDMTDEEKGAMLLAHHEGKDIEWNFKSVKTGKLMGWTNCPDDCLWDPDFVYRIKPEPKVETVALDLCGKDGWSACEFALGERQGMYMITFNLINGKPDTSSIKMETL